MNEEEALVRAFIVPSKRERVVGLLASPKRRKKFTSSLAHFGDLDPRWMIRIPPSEHFPPMLERLLRARGAGDSCYLVSEDGELDGKRLPLGEALERVVGRGMGTLISCVPGELGVFEGEEASDRCILARRAI